MFESAALWQTCVVWVLLALSLARLALHFFPGLPAHLRKGARGLLQRAGLADAAHGVGAARNGDPKTYGCRSCSGCACAPQREATLQRYRRDEDRQPSSVIES
ncbi:DUF6587 family protein [Bordetella sp. 15P40C-2]|uniref:DUF6587 family protein n=1 Tax=Bordetella sp. 15P40C-2 TaxID=2572246 RepID=UPI00351B6ED7